MNIWHIPKFGEKFLLNNIHFRNFWQQSAFISTLSKNSMGVYSYSALMRFNSSPIWNLSQQVQLTSVPKYAFWYALAIQVYVNNCHSKY